MTSEIENPGNRDKDEKRNWFHSLRRRKSSTSTNSSSQPKQPTNNSGISMVGAAAATSTQASSKETPPENGNNMKPTPGRDRKRKDDRKNIFQKLKKRMSDLGRQKKTKKEATTSSNSPQPEGVVCYPNDLMAVAMNSLDPPEMIPFTHSYRRFVTKKWQTNTYNRVMYTACSEMLSQVWYWGEISRHEAQRQLKDKPIGSFLVRDSESMGASTSWYTLSFRILNCTLHYRLEHRFNYWHFEELQYESIVEMIEDILHRCTKDHFVCYVRVLNELQPPLAVVLKYPVSRYITIMKLQDLCRRVIQQHVAVEQVPELQIPLKLREYLTETPELVFQSS